jgi:tetratricopeptide (TPR) repeat protein
MRRNRYLGFCGVLLFSALFLALAPRAAAQFNGSVHGQIKDLEGKPWAGIVVELVNDQGAKIQAKTDSKGNYLFGVVKPGVYQVSVQMPSQSPYKGDKFQVEAAKDVLQDFNFKEIQGQQAKTDPKYAEAMKKQEEDKQKIEGVKGHFNAGRTYLEQMNLKKAEITKAMQEKVPADQRDAKKQKVDAMQQQLVELSNQAVGEFQAAQKLVSEKDTNQHLFWYNMASAYDVAGRDDEAINAYKQAIAAKGDSADVAPYYNNLGNVLARDGKIDDARAAYLKSAELNPANAAGAWLNFGISLDRANRLKEAAEPLRKATELDPKNVVAWYMLGRALVANAEFKQVGDKQEMKFPDGTAEAYQKVIELDPNGRYGAEAKEALAGLQQAGLGVTTKYSSKKKKS